MRGSYGFRRRMQKWQEYDISVALVEKEQVSGIDDFHWRKRPSGNEHIFFVSFGIHAVYTRVGFTDQQELGMAKKRSSTTRYRVNDTNFQPMKSSDRTGAIPNLYTVLEAAKVLRCSRASLYNLMLKKRELRSIKSGSRRLVTEIAILDYIRKKEKEAEQPGQ